MSSQEETVEKDINTSETPVQTTENTSEVSSICDNVPVEDVTSNQHDPPKEEHSNVEEKLTEEEKCINTETENQVAPEETNENDTSDKTSSSKSRELKSILALSKEAKLDTNLPAKRKESTRKRDFAKLHSIGLSERSPSKSSQESKAFKFPVTAEAELDEENFSKPHGIGLESPKPMKRARTSSRDSGASSNDGSQRNRRIGSGEIHMLKPNKDMFCWRCHKDNVNIACETCPRSYHWKCLRQTVKNDKEHWPCPECVSILKAESTHTRSEAMKGMTLEHLCSLLKYALNRMIQCQGSEPFLHAVNDEDFPDYKKYIIQPMDLTKIEKNIKNNLYGSTQAFEADAKWILHNCIIFNSYQSKLTYTAKNIVRVCKQEMAEIELCPNCYLNANSKKNTWFVEVCPKPHILVWAKLKGFPYWPAKAMCTNPAGMVDVRFFGAHDRAWVHYKECYLYSEKDPNTFKQKRYDIEKCIEEVDVYIENLKKVYGEFRYAPYKTFLEPENEVKQLQIFLPKYKNQPNKQLKKRFRDTISSHNKSESSGDESKQGTSKSEESEDEKKMAVTEETKTEEAATDETVKDGDKTEGVDDETEDVKEEKNTQTENETEQKDMDETISSPISPIHDNSKLDNDTTMEEGYGTDDSTADDIDLERRRAFVDPDHNTSVNEEVMEDEEDADTQVPNNISVDSLLRGKVRMRGGLTATPGKIKILPRRKSEALDSLKRHSSENSENVHQKLPRRNSDQSNKSDSSRISNISDKINRIETFENMEVTLGTGDVARVSISEDVSCDSSLKSGSSENSVEIKRRPVQVDIDNAEFTISPSNKLKISDTLIKRLSDSSSPEESPQVEKVKKSLVNEAVSSNATSPSKSQTDMLIEKFKDVVEHKVVDFKALVEEKTSTDKKDEDTKNDEDNEVAAGNDDTKDADTKSNERETSTNTPSKKKSTEETIKKPETPEQKDCKTSDENKETQECSPTSELLKKQKLLIQPSITDFTKTLKKPDAQLEKKRRKSSDEDSGDSASEDEEENIKSLEIDKKRIFTIIHSSLNEEKQIAQKKNDCVESFRNDNKTAEENNKNLCVKSNEVEKNEGIKLIIRKKDIVKETDTEDRNKKSIETKAVTTEDKSNESKTNKEDVKKKEIKDVDVKKGNKEGETIKEDHNKEAKSKSDETNNSEDTSKVVKIKIAEIKSPPSNKSPKQDMIKQRVVDPSVRKSIEKQIVPVKASISQTGTSNKEFRSYSNIKNKNKVAVTTNEEAKTSDKGNDENMAETRKDAEPVQVLPAQTPKKRKISSDENSSAPSTKLVKLVPIESILNKGLKHKNIRAVTLQQGGTTIAKPPLNRSISESSVIRPHSSEEMVTETIKSEPESDDDFQESENLEAKKRYLSALNISERTSDLSKMRENEIRTRSRAEEKRERFKIVDNLTRVIDDVALNYSANHEGEDLPEKKRPILSSGSTWSEGEITVKSFAKLSNSTPQNQQRARKSFPTPSSSKTIVKQPQVSIMRKDGNPVPATSPNVSNKEISSTSTSVANSTHNHIQPSTTSYTTQLASSSCSSSTTTTASSSSSNSAILRPVQSLSTSTVLMGHSNTLTATVNPTVTITSMPSCTLQTKPHEQITAGTVPHVILFPNPTMNYGSPIVSPMIGMVSSTLPPQIPLISAVTPTSQTIAQQPQQPQLKLSNKPYNPPNVSASQNYIPQNEGRIIRDLTQNRSTTTAANNIILNNLLNQQGGVTCPTITFSSNNTSSNGGCSEQQQQQMVVAGAVQTTNGTSIPTPLRERPPDEDLTLLNSIVPENVTRAVSELMMRPPPRLKPKPPGMLNTVFDDGIPSSAGEITAKINSVAHRMNDYLRGMLIETLEDLGRSANPEAKIISLQLEIEALKYKHNLEMQEIKKNMGTLLKDIQRSIEENRERIISEARSAWETETIKRVELAKSKQWCANCSKEAKFYCCWNTSYCDYPCQQKHWPQHMGKCTQNIEKSTGTGPVVPSHPVAGQPVILRQTTGGQSKSGTAPRMVTKPTKVYMNNNKTATGSPKTFKGDASRTVSSSLSGMGSSWSSRTTLPNRN